MTDPSGLRGILMTDLEGSTSHLRTLGDDYGSTLALHHAIIHAAIADHAGLEVGSEGDSFAVVFDDTGSAVRAAVQSQQQLARTSWPDAPWRVRMAVHAGEVERSDAGAVGIALHHAARVRAVAHGGQVIVSDIAREALRDDLPDGIGLTDLGSHVVRDFAEPVRLHQVRGPGLAADFPPLRTVVTRAVPAMRTTFVGRSAELTALVEAVEAQRLVTVTGPGGSGKTRLAFEAARLAETERVEVVRLAGVRTGSQAAAETAKAVGAPDPDVLAETIGAQELLLVVDNCEHVVDDVARVASNLLDNCPGLTILATSREPLLVQGEVVWPLPPMASSEAVELLRSRASGSIDDELAPAVCERLGSMPLAIELAAARLRSMPFAELAARLDDQLSVLTTGSRDEPRHQTLRATLDWSHGLLSPDEQAVFRRLGVFASDFSFDAAVAVASMDEPRLIDGLDGLVTRSLVEMSFDRSRYHLLEPIRQYALAHLVDSDESDDVNTSFVRWASSFADRATRNLVDDQRTWTANLDRERDNLGAAMAWALEHDRAADAARMGGRLGLYWFNAARNDAFVWVPALLERVDQLDPSSRISVLLAAGINYADLADDPRPVAWLREAEAIARTAGNRRALGDALFFLCRAASLRGDYETASRAIEEAIPLREELGDRVRWGWAMIWRGILARHALDFDRAEEIELDVTVRCEDVPHVVAGAWFELAEIDHAHGELDQAETRITHGMEAFRELGDRWLLGVALGKRAEIRVERDPSSAAEAVIESIRTLQAVGADPNLARAVRLSAYLLYRTGHESQAATLMGSIPRLDDPPVLEQWPPSLHPMVLTTSSLSHDPTWSTELARGSRLGINEACDTAIAWLEQAGATVP